MFSCSHTSRVNITNLVATLATANRLLRKCEISWFILPVICDITWGEKIEVCRSLTAKM
jgi:hypothetical protein